MSFEGVWLAQLAGIFLSHTDRRVRTLALAAQAYARTMTPAVDWRMAFRGRGGGPRD